MKSYIATDQYGNTVTVSAYTDARQKAEVELGFGNVVSFQKLYPLSFHIEF